ncbi:carbohydrate ABC transporter permease [Paenibacillus agaridevorans]|uniref:Carbohydrate ABC transporter permease n=1 Tax=Paenibacillus agaridevorans TaxID=171404 RepID=A0A2R5EXK0_9BACL|nr:carbohydrate ABC transporter permease [Paenibacillus agaridevorans]GBG10855.1 carbohydrate ABC transporter permease [Paenibacillus agaridevorans]
MNGRLNKLQPFDIFNYVGLALISLLCLLPIWHIAMVSLSGEGPASKFSVGLLPIEFSMDSYKTILQMGKFWDAFGMSSLRVLVGGLLNFLLTIMLAYPLSKESSYFRGRNIYIWFLVFTMLFSGGLIPMYMIINELNLINTIWALVLPGAVPVFNVILMVNFMRQLPKELEEAALVDGASQYRIMTSIFIPLSMPVIATVTLFSVVGHWNSWFDGLIFMNDTANYPLQTYLHVVLASRNLINADQQTVMASLTNRNSISAQIILASLPILVVYPFLQRFFIHGIVMGSVKE